MTSIVFMGTPDFSVPVLQGLVDAGYTIKAVVTQPDKAVGRKQRLQSSPVKKLASQLKLPVLQPAKLSGSPEMAEIIQMAPDLIITAAFGQFLPTKLLKTARIAAVNVHGSLLPKYRGGAPIQRAIMAGDPETGITVMYMAKKMDAGDIIAQKAIPIAADDDAGTLFAKLAIVGRDLLLAQLPDIIHGTAKRIPQNEDQVTFAYNIQPAEEELDFRRSAAALERQIRGLKPDPGAYLRHAGERIKVWGAIVREDSPAHTPGTIVAKGKHELAVATGNGALAITQLQPAGKASMPITSYLNGAGQHLQVGDTFADLPAAEAAHE
ncbi:methionyl-tRNA formyltransferase [Schleiferilactobacillus shenzhenensis]|nr:methionyl-tRNA formyltransferase [Schleiferilactobacillus shenzhenensis]